MIDAFADKSVDHRAGALVEMYVSVSEATALRRHIRSGRDERDSVGQTLGDGFVREGGELHGVERDDQAGVGLDDHSMG